MSYNNRSSKKIGRIVSSKGSRDSISILDIIKYKALLNISY